MRILLIPSFAGRFFRARGASSLQGATSDRSRLGRGLLTTPLAGLVFAWLACAGSLTTLRAGTVLLSTNRTISATDLALDGLEVVISNCQVRIDGAHRFDSLALVSNAVVSHSACTETEVFKLDLQVAGLVVIDKSSRLDVTARGYLPGRTLGNTTEGGAKDRVGGSYGGFGSYGSGGQLNAVYGDFRNPNELGSGGGNANSGGAGGGLIRLIANAVVVEGAIQAHGGDGWSSGNEAAGSGGSIFLQTGSLTGGGSISANGGVGNWNGGSGSGGRIAIYCDTSIGMAMSNINATGRSGPHGASALGTVYIRESSQRGILRIASNGASAGQYTPLGIASDTVIDLGSEDLLISGSGVVVRPDHQMAITANNLVLEKGAVLTTMATTTTQEYSLRIQAQTVQIDKDSQIDVSGNGYLSGRTLGNTTVGGATGRAGGSYGGFGSYGSGGQLNSVYGDFRNPNELGSGGGNDNIGGSGGGLIRLVASSLVVEGAIKANGGDGWSSGNETGGSGGGIYLKVGSLTGGGAISANGGIGSWNGGSGSGGRIAIYCDTAIGVDPKNINVQGQNGPHGASAVGTIYVRESSQRGILRILSNDASTGLYTSLGVATNGIIDLATEDLLISGSGVTVRPDHQMAIKVYSLTIEKGAVLSTLPATADQEYSLQIEAQTVQIDKDSKIDVTAMGYLPGQTLGNTNSGGATGRAGGSYGALGSYGSGGEPNAVYGDFRNPNELGSGGGNANNGGSGGGLVRLLANSLVLDGAIKADGGNGWDSGHEAAGSGGGVYIRVSGLMGAGNITANGGTGNWNGGSGSGGRIAIYFASNSIPTTNITALGHAGPGGPSAVGTVYAKQENQPGVLRIDNFGTPSGVWTPLGVGTNQTLDLGQENLVLSGNNVVVKPEHQMPLKVNQLSLVKGAVLTTRATTINQEYSLQIEAQSVQIDGDSKIDATGMGYLPGLTLGNTNSGGATGRAGGSYGGLGSYGSGGVLNRVYGDFRNPNELGSGGGNANNGGSGGGLIRLAANSVVLDGAILANGGDGWDSGHEAAGSGGGIWLQVGALSGHGLMSANGGKGNWNGGSGGGGRIALYYATNSLPMTNIVALGKNGPGGPSAVGTVYAKQDNQPGVLRIDNHGNPTGTWTPLGIDSDQVLDLSQDHLVLSGPNLVAKPARQMTMQIKQLTVEKGATLTHLPATDTATYSLDIEAGTLFVDGTSQINVSALGYWPGRTTGNSTVGGAMGRAGGSYGGWGSIGSDGTPNRVYGDYHHPIEPGSGGGNANFGGSGGGLVRIKANEIVLDGSLKADGGDGWSSGNECGGSGGGVYIQTGSLTGAGSISANGGIGYWNGGSGGGGRIAIYYDATNSIEPTRITALGRNGPHRTSAVGTIYTKLTGGLGLLRIDNNGAPSGSWTPLGVSSDTVFDMGEDNLLVSGTNVIVKPEHQMRVISPLITLSRGAMMTHLPSTGTATFSLELSVDELIVDEFASINVTGMGYLPGRTTGNSPDGGATGRAGGSYGGLGHAGSDGIPNAVYGDLRNVDEPGSGGGSANFGGSGGGLVRVFAQSISLDGIIQANGGNGWSSGNEAAGSGGGVLLNSARLSGKGSITAVGGKGYWSGGNGGGGRLAIFTWVTNELPTTNLSVAGGTGGYGPGNAGSVYLASAPIFYWNTTDNPVFHDTKLLQYVGLGIDPSVVRVDLTAYRAGTAIPIAADQYAMGTLSWDTRTVADGAYQLEAVFYDASHQVIGNATRDVFVNNAATWHSGIIQSNETWLAGTVHVVEETVTIPAGVTVTVQPGALVKFAPGAQVAIQAGGVFNVTGVSGQPIILTSLADDTVGGDTGMDGNKSKPQPGSWNGVSLAVGATLAANEFTDFRYLKTAHGGTLAANETWIGTFLHQVNSDVYVPAGVTLTIQAGAVIKFEQGAGLVVQDGGQIVADGTVALPIVFTSLRDDTVGGDTNGDGDKTQPSGGDWHWILVNNASGLFNHCQWKYGGGPAEGGWGPSGGPGKATLKTVGSASLTVSNSWIMGSYYDGVLAWGGQVTLVNSLFTGIDRAVCAHPGSQVRVMNCTLNDNRIGLLAHGGTLNAFNTIVANSLDSGLQYDFGSLGLVQYCDIWSTNSSGVNYRNATDLTGQYGNISVDPKFKNPDQGNFRLRYLSPAIDAADGTLAPATDLMGAPRYDDPRVGNTGVATTNGAYADIGAYEFVEAANSDIDLVVVSVDGPVAPDAGEEAVLSWSIMNAGSTAFMGPWHDAVYLVRVDNNQRIFAGEVLVGAGAIVGPGGIYEATGKIVVPGGVATEYRWEIVANSRGEIFEGSKSQNNAGDSLFTAGLQIPELSLNGTPMSGNLSVVSPNHYFRFQGQAGASVQVAVDLAASNAITELYVGEGFMPTPQTYTVCQREWNSADVTALINNATTNDYYLLVYCRALAVDQSDFTIRAGVVDFSIDHFNPARIGNSGLVTVELFGAQLNPGTVFTLVGANGERRPAVRTSFHPVGNAFATFDPRGVSAGAAHVEAAQGGLKVLSGAALDVISGGAGGFYASVTGPKTIRLGRSGTWYITYGNQGLVDVPLPLLRFRMDGAQEIRLFQSTLNWADRFVLLGLNDRALLPTLGPGQEVTIPVQVKPGSSGVANLEVISGESAAASQTPFNWEQIPAPSGANAADWQSLLSSLNGRLGATLAQYYSLLMRDLDDVAAAPMEHQYLANINGQWLFGAEIGGVDVAKPIIEVDDSQDTAASSEIQALSAPVKKPGDGIRKTYFVVILDQDYRNSGANNLRDIADDHNDLTQYLKQDLRVPDEQMNVLFDSIDKNDDTITRQSVINSITNMQSKVDGDDDLVIWYGGHGGRGQHGSGYWFLHDGRISAVALQGAMDQVGANNTYLVSDSCHSGALLAPINPVNTHFVGIAGTAADRVSWGTVGVGGALTSRLKGNLRNCNNLQQAFNNAENDVKNAYAGQADPASRQDPELYNAGGVNLNEKPWRDPSGYWQRLGQTMVSLAYTGVSAFVTSIVNSFDPNDKVGPGGAGEGAFVQEDQILSYTIDFENKSTALAPAQEVLITDQLTTNLDWSTFSIGTIGFNGVKVTVPPGLQQYSNSVLVATDPNPVFIEVSLNPTTGKVTWLIWSEDPVTGDLPEDPFAGFLPPNDATHRGEGYVTYTVRPKSNLPTGTEIVNQGVITFDPTYGANAPINTPFVTNRLDSVAPSSSVAPLPPISGLTFTVSWTGVGETNGSGLASYDLYVSRNGDAYVPWLIGTTLNQAVFQGEPGAQYRFCSVARDRAGNIEEAPISPDATTTIIVTLQMVRTGSRVSVRWPASATGYQLETVTTLPATGQWQSVPDQSVLDGDHFKVDGQPLDPKRFYRLRKL